MKRFILLSLFAILLPVLSQALSREKTEANIVGHVLANGEHLPFVNISIRGTTIGTLTDESGHFVMPHLPLGELVITAYHIGYKPQEVRIHMEAGTTREVNFQLEADVLGLEGVVVTGDRNARQRNESPVIVNAILSGLFTSTHSVSLSEALNFSPGLRMENNCQNCGFTQVRMNGLEGPYSQILINSRPIFSGLAGVYGLELIPSNMIERIEVVRGGGSALYGSNAIAGTINLILKDPMANEVEAGFSSGMSGLGLRQSGGHSSDHTGHFNASMVASDFRTGFAVYGFFRSRDPFDANGDGFSELTTLDNNTLGGRFYQRMGNRGKLSADFFNIREERRGGNRFDYPLHEADIAEAVTHKITTAAVTYEHFTRDYDLLSVYASGQRIDRDSYYGANRALDGYGHTTDFSFNSGMQYKAILGSSVLTGGVEYTGGRLRDNKLGYPDWMNGQEVEHIGNTVIADQLATSAGAFAQHDYSRDRLLVSVGARLDHYRVEDREGHSDTRTGLIFSPRINLLYNISSSLQGRLSFSNGYRAPQIYDEDLHIESSGSRRVIYQNAPDLKEEKSRTYMASLEWSRQAGSNTVRILAEAFRTSLTDPFANEFGQPDEWGTVVYTRVNAGEGALVQGINLEANLVTAGQLSISAAFTLQSNHYDEAQEFDETRFFRSPGSFGFVVLEKEFKDTWKASLTASHTGSMLVPYFGPALPDPETGELRETASFLDLGLRLNRVFTIQAGQFQVFAGVKNLLNAYQTDFDHGIERDPGYIYGPSLPRTIYIGLKAGNRSLR
jgi:outer membrane receptor for ferrienterochelin and colicins